MKEAEEEEEESLLKDFPHLLFSPLLLIFLGSFYPIRKDLVDFLPPPFPPLPRGANQTVAPTIPCPENPIGVAFSTRR